MTMYDKTQARIDGFVLANWYSMDTDQKIAFIMLKENLFYDEAKRRVMQAISEMKQCKGQGQQVRDYA